jgi:hypothetical protein
MQRKLEAQYEVDRGKLSRGVVGGPDGRSWVSRTRQSHPQGVPLGYGVGEWNPDG